MSQPEPATQIIPFDFDGADPAWRGFDDDGGDLLPTQKENVG